MKLKAKLLSTLSLLMALPLSATEDAIWPEQYWSKKDQFIWYQLSQGSRLIPLNWYNMIVDPETNLLFSSKDNMQRFGFPYKYANDVFPIGFVKDKDQDKNQWVGLNCAACHTSAFTKNNQEFFVHGGQTMGNFKSFLTALKASVKNASETPEILQKIATVQNKDSEALKAEMIAWLNSRDDEDIILRDTENWGPGRVDAVAYIQSKAARVVQSERPSVAPQANAPVNPPHVWNTNQQERLQHSGLVSNGPDLGLFGSTRMGAYFRNYAEALGVFSEINFNLDEGVNSSINVQNLMKIERALINLPSPKWPENVLGEINNDLSAEGEKIYAENCVSCHSLLHPDDLSTEIKLFKPNLKRGQPFLKIIPVIDESLTNAAISQGITPNEKLIGTDAAMVCNFLMRTVPTGILKGQAKKNSLVSLKYFDKFSDRDAAMEIISAIAVGDIKAKTTSGDLLEGWASGEIDGLSKVFVSWFEKPKTTALTSYSLTGGNPNQPASSRARADCAAYVQGMYNSSPQNFPYPGYKARPLNGIWASPPYLHNGSVPTLYDLLSRQEKRPTQFTFMGVEYDSTHIGLAYQTHGEQPDFRVYGDQGEELIGQWNGGHEYGVDLLERDKMALIEYLKGL